MSSEESSVKQKIQEMSEDFDFSLSRSTIPYASPVAIKHDQGKDDFTYVSIEMMTALARVREFGSKKYSRDNWKKGFKISRSLAAALRHIFARLSGQKYDSESGLDHLWHAACCLEHAIFDAANHPYNEINPVVDHTEDGR